MTKRTRPITSPLKQGVKFVITIATKAIVRERLAELSTPPVLIYPNWDAVNDNSRPFLLYYDASVEGSGATLENEQDNHNTRPIVFISRATIESERCWTPLELEAGSIVCSIMRLGKLPVGYQFWLGFRPQGAQTLLQDYRTHPVSTEVTRISHCVQLHPGKT